MVRFKGDKEAAKKPYSGMQPLTAVDIADNIAYVASRPPHVQIADMLVFPTGLLFQVRECILTLCFFAAQASAQVVHRKQ